jgi:hypothetical protein
LIHYYKRAKIKVTLLHYGLFELPRGTQKSLN